MDIFFKNDGSYSQSTVGIPVLVDYTPVGFVREVNADMVTCSLFDKFIGKEWLAQRLTTKEPDISDGGTVHETLPNVQCRGDDAVDGLHSSDA